MEPHRDFGSAAKQPAHRPILQLRAILSINPEHQGRVIDTAVSLIRPDTPETVKTLLVSAIRDFQHCRSLPQNSVGQIASDLIRSGFTEVMNQIEAEQEGCADNRALAQGYLSRFTLGGLQNGML